MQLSDTCYRTVIKHGFQWLFVSSRNAANMSVLLKVFFIIRYTVLFHFFSPSCRPVLSVIITRENRLDLRSALIHSYLSLVMIADRFGLHAVLLPLLFTAKRSQSSFWYVSQECSAYYTLRSCDLSLLSSIILYSFIVFQSLRLPQVLINHQSIYLSIYLRNVTCMLQVAAPSSQDRLERIWTLLCMPDAHRLDMAVKYSADPYSDKLDQVKLFNCTCIYHLWDLFNLKI